MKGSPIKSRHRMAARTARSRSGVMPQPLWGRQPQLLGLGVGPVDFPDLFQDKTHFFRKAGGQGNKLASSVRLIRCTG